MTSDSSGSGRLSIILIPFFSNGVPFPFPEIVSFRIQIENILGEQLHYATIKILLRKWYFVQRKEENVPNTLACRVIWQVVSSELRENGTLCNFSLCGVTSNSILSFSSAEYNSIPIILKGNSN